MSAGWAEIQGWCRCGDRFKAGAGDGSDPRGVIEAAGAAFWHVHSGGGHGPTTPDEARRARRRADRRGSA